MDRSNQTTSDVRRCGERYATATLCSRQVVVKDDAIIGCPPDVVDIIVSVVIIQARFRLTMALYVQRSLGSTNYRVVVHLSASPPLDQTMSAVEGQEMHHGPRRANGTTWRKRGWGTGGTASQIPLLLFKFRRVVLRLICGCSLVLSKEASRGRMRAQQGCQHSKDAEHSKDADSDVRQGHACVQRDHGAQISNPQKFSGTF